MRSRRLSRLADLRVLLTRAAALGAGAIFLAGLGTSLTTSLFTISASVALAAFLVALTSFKPQAALVTTLSLLLVLGGARRLVEFGLAGPATVIDPLFLIAPLVTLALLAIAVRRGALRDRTPLASVVLGICIVGVIGALNPLQGGFLAAAMGLAVFMTPVLWFWIGRALIDDRLMGQTFTVATAIAVLAAVYGLAQTSGWFLSWDAQWVAASEEYASLRVASFVRGFGFSSSAAEYGKLLAAAIVVAAVSLLLLRRRGWWLPVLPVLAVALFLSGLRTTFVLTVVAVGVIWGARRRASIAQLVVYGSVALIALMLIVSQATPNASRESAASVLADRQLVGLSDPFNSRASTLHTHIGLVVRAFQGLVSAPIGQGTATITIAGKRFGISQAGDTDIADAAIAFGVLGIPLYIALCVRLFRRAHLLAVRRGDRLSLAALGVTVVSSLQWLNGGLYAANVLAWLTFGWIDRAAAELPDDQPSLKVVRARVGSL